MPTSPIVLALNAFALATCLFAILKGGAAERLATGLIVVNIVLWAMGEQFLSASLAGVALLADDALTAIGLLLITLRYGTPWLGGAMLLYAAQFSLHAYYFVLEKPPTDRFHIIVNNLDFLGILLCLAFGTFSAMGRRARLARA